MKNKRRLILLLAIMVMLICTSTLIGCQLAIPTTTTMKVTSDTLCGVFVTIGDRNILINEKASKDIDLTFNSKGEAILDEFAFASLSENRIEGKMTEDKSNVVFDGIRGYYLGSLHEQDENGEFYNVLMCDPSLNDAKYAVNVIDNTKEQTAEATLYVSTKFHEAFSLNPVYLTTDGIYYTIPDHAQSTSFSGSTLGSIYSQTIDSAITKTNDNFSKTEQNHYKINVTVVDEVKKTTIKEMNQNDKLIETTEYLPNSPEEFTVDSDTAYVIVEEVLAHSLEDSPVKRSIYIPLSRDSNETSNQHRCNFPGEKGVIAQKQIKFICK